MIVRYKKRRLFAPIVVSALHYSILICLWISSDALRSWTSLIAWTFWPCAVACLVSYYQCCFGDPGFQGTCVSEYLPSSVSDRVPGVLERAERAALERAQNAGHMSPHPTSSEDRLKLRVDDERSSSLSLDGDQSLDSNISGEYLVGGEHVVIDFASEEMTATTTAEFLSSKDSSVGGRRATDATRLIKNSFNERNTSGERAVAHGGALEIITESRSYAEKMKNCKCPRILMFSLYAVMYAFVSLWSTIRLIARIFTLPIFGTLLPHIPQEASSDCAECEESLNDILRLGVSTIYQDGEKLWYCLKCKIFRPLRSKHCNSCGYCVRAYDHHCPWIGVCVGERNHGWFYLFLLYQSVELIYATVLAVCTTIVDSSWLDNDLHPSPSKIAPHVYLMFMILIMMSLGLVTSSLFVFHTVLMASNMSSWELTCWDNISYLKAKCKTRGSPFGADTIAKNFMLSLQIFNPLFRSRGNSRWIARSLKKFRVGPNDELFWVSSSDQSKRGYGEYGPAPKLLANDLCNLYDLCA